MSSSVDTAEVALTILRRIRQMERRISEHSKALSKAAGLTVPQILCLRAIDELQRSGVQVTLAALSAQVSLSAATVSRIVDRLLRADLVTRERGTSDRRKIHLALTPRGAAQVADLPTPLQERFIMRLGRLPDAEQTQLVDTLTRLTEMMDAADVVVDPLE